MEIYQLFPIAVGKFQYDDITEKELNFVQKLDYGKNAGNQISTSKQVLESPQLKKIKKFINTSVQEYFQKICCPNKNLKIYTHLSWTNITTKGQFHHKHAHPNSYLSGVFYFQSTENDKIHFFKNAYQQLEISPAEFNIYNSESWWYPADTGRLLIFPNSLYHEVYILEHDTPRISLSFNTWLQGPTGNPDLASFVHLN